MSIPHHPEPIAGTNQFHRPEDQQRETSLANIIATRLNVTMLPLGRLSHIDYIAQRDDRPIAGVELISRNYTHQDLTNRGGIYIKATTLNQGIALANAPLSIAWQGVYFFYDLTDGLYYQEARLIRGAPVTMHDSRQRVPSDTEPGIAINNLRLWQKWAEERTNQHD